jgi:O-antigen/teichoic acid export membrane protein
VVPPGLDPATGAPPAEAGVEEVPARRASGGVLAAFGLRLGATGLGVVAAALLTRTLGPARFGELAVILAVAMIASGLGDLGTTQVAVAEMAARPERRREVAAGYAAVRAGVGTALAVVGVAVLAVLLDRGEAAWAGVAVMASLPLAGVSGLAVAAQARLRPQVGAALSLGQTVAWLAAVAVAAALGAPLWAYGLAFLGSNLAQAAATWLVVVRPEPPAWDHWRPALGDLVRRSRPLAVAGVFAVAYYRLDGLLVFALAGAAEAGNYAAAYRFLDAVQLLPAAMVAVLVPLLARRWTLADRAGFERTLRLGMAVAAAAGAVAATVAVTAGDRVAAALFGPDFGRAGTALRVLGLAFFSVATGYVYSAVLIATGRLRIVALVSALAAAGSVAAGLAAIPRWGATGAAWVTVAVEYGVSTSLAVWLHRHHRLAFPWRPVAGSVGAALVAALAAWPLRAAPLPLLLAAPAAAFAVTARLLGALTPADLRALADPRLGLGRARP